MGSETRQGLKLRLECECVASSQNTGLQKQIEYSLSEGMHSETIAIIFALSVVLQMQPLSVRFSRGAPGNKK